MKRPGDDQPPWVEKADDLVKVRFSRSPTARELDVECVLDLTRFNDLIGIEILDLRKQLGGAEPSTEPGTDAVRWSYDDEIDAFYMHLIEDTAPVQRSAIARAYVDDTNRLIGLDVPLGTDA